MSAENFFADSVVRLAIGTNVAERSGRHLAQ
jgi:hypothetical protein